ncbi:MAG TPA: macro domain-containing protein [Rhizomicrobium sp.]|nr:macro domain-containing protein [Rhizomicrobium sp.]
MGEPARIARKLQAIEADITTLGVDAIVNAANVQLLPGGGVDGAIRRAAGPKLTEETRAIGKCPTGTAVLTQGYDLPAKYAIHTAAPIWEGGYRDEEQERLLSSCYESALELADAHGIATIAFPAIGTGIYGWPAERAAKIAFETVVRHLAMCRVQTRVIFCCFNTADRERYAKLIAGLAD